MSTFLKNTMILCLDEQRVWICFQMDVKHAKLLIKFLSLLVRIMQCKEEKWAKIKGFQPTQSQNAIIPTRS